MKIFGSYLCRNIENSKGFTNFQAALYVYNIFMMVMFILILIIIIIVIKTTQQHFPPPSILMTEVPLTKAPNP